MTYHEPKDPRTGKAPDHQKAALKAARNISNAEVKSEDEEYPEKHGFTSEEVKEINEATDAELLDDEPFNEMRGRIYQFDDGTEWLIFEDYDEAESKCVEYVRNDLEYNPEVFDQDWLEGFISMTDTDRRMMANDEATNYAYEVIDEDDAMKEADLDDKYDELDGEIDTLENEIDDLNEERDNLDTDRDEEEGKDEEDEDVINDLDNQISDIEDEIKTKENERDALSSEQEELPDEAREQVESTKYDEIYEELDDPVEYFVTERGMYSIEDLMKASFISIDIDEAAQDAVDMDGVAHFLASYDGNVTELDNGMVMYRTN